MVFDRRAGLPPLEARTGAGEAATPGGRTATVVRGQGLGEGASGAEREKRNERTGASRAIVPSGATPSSTPAPGVSAQATPTTADI
ncbi:hypothetical protein DCC79_05910 [bacterium]|nr:hypothetical protein [Chloroflexi bacterium CFX6]RIL11114.1 MAG: hypothetical protein DCC79_05910 [bacterium]